MGLRIYCYGCGKEVDAERDALTGGPVCSMCYGGSVEIIPGQYTYLEICMALGTSPDEVAMIQENLDELGLDL